MSRFRTAADFQPAELRHRPGLLAENMLRVRRTERYEILPDSFAKLAKRFTEDRFKKYVRKELLKKNKIIHIFTRVPDDITHDVLYNVHLLIFRTTEILILISFRSEFAIRTVTVTY